MTKSLLLFCFTILFFSTFDRRAFAAEEQAEIGVIGFPADLNVETSIHPAAVLIRSLAAQTLLRTGAQSQATASGSNIELLLAEGFNVDGEFKHWGFKLRPRVTFHNGRAISGLDVVYSIERCSKNSSNSPALRVSLTRNGRDDTENDEESRAIEISLLASTITPSLRSSFMEFLSNCPIIPEREAALFEKNWGRGTNLIGGGAYRLTSFRAGSSYTLTKFDEYFDLQPTFGVLKVRGFDDAGHGLTALRLGTIIALVTSDEKINDLAKKDETLLVHRCPISNVIARRSVRLSCTEKLMDFWNLRYVG